MQNQYSWMKILGISVLTLALAATGVTAAFRAQPGLMVLVRSHIKSRSPFCKAWQTDVGTITRQQEAIARFRGESRRLRSEGDLTLWRMAGRDYWMPASDDAILPILLAQTERGIYGTEAWDVRPGDVVLDAGAYVGTYTRHALERGAKLVVAIEPSPTSLECLRRNLAGEIAAGRVIVYPKGVWDREDVLNLFVNPDNTSGNGFLPGGIKSGAIPVTTISKVVHELNLSRVDFIKADIKGATERMLRGGSDVLVRDRPRMALSTEELADDAGSIAALAKSIQPAYGNEGGARAW